MKTPSRFCLAVLAAACCGSVTAAEDAATRTIVLRQDDAQVRFASKVYELKNAATEEILPFINSAVLRYDRNSSVRRVTSAKGRGEAILVSTGKKFMPYVDKIVATLDRKVARKTTDGSTIAGTGLTRVSYTPKYRGADELARVINATVTSSAGALFINDETNTIFWRDQAASAKRTLSWLEKLDRPLPQVRVRVNYYELCDSDLKDWGFDYLAWKNGPGVNLLNLGYNAGRIVVDEVLEGRLNDIEVRRRKEHLTYGLERCDYQVVHREEHKQTEYCKYDGDRGITANASVKNDGMLSGS